MRKLKLFSIILFVTLLVMVPLYQEQQVQANTSLNYKGTLLSSQNHTYYFSNSIEGELRMSFATGKDSFFELVDINTNLKYEDMDILPVGEYKVTLIPKDNTNLSYDLTLSGSVNLTGNTTLPSLNITSPSSAYTRLNKGVFSINYQGNSNGSKINYTLNKNNPIALTSSFSRSLSLLFGENTISTYAELSNKNSVIDVRSVVSPGVKRISGPNRYSGSVEISKEIEREGYEIDTVIIASGSSYLDGLAGTVLAYQETAPILLTESNQLPSVIVDEIKRLGAKNAIILGGTATISTTVESSLKGLGLNVERLSGADRYVTSINIAKKIITPNSNGVIVVSGGNYPDGLLVSPYAARSGKPILYTKTDELPSTIKAFLSENPNINEFTIIGGTASVSTAVETELENFGSVYRVSGKDRYEVGIKLGYALDYKKSTFVLVSNETDGVPAAVLGSIKGAQLFLTKPAELPPSVDSYFSGLGYEHLLDNIYIVGGTASVAQSIEDKLNSVVR